MTVIIFLLILSLLVFVHELGHFLAAKKNGVKVEEFGFGLPPRVWGIKKGETIYSLNLLPIGGFVKLYGEEYYEDKKMNKELKQRAFVYKSPLAKAFILVAGVLGNFLLGWIIISYLFTVGIQRPITNVRIEGTQVHSPADAAGLEKGDIVKEIKKNGKSYEIKTTNDIQWYLKRFAGDKITIIVKRNNEQKEFSLIPRKNPPTGQGATGIIITNRIEKVIEKKYPWYQAPFYGLKDAYDNTALIVREFVRIIFTFLSFQKPDVDVAGPVGIAKLTGLAAKAGINTLLEFIALLSLNLAVINILPFPALDGGRLVFVIFEGITKKRPNKNIEKYLNLIGFVILLSLAVLISIRDIMKFYR